MAAVVAAVAGARLRDELAVRCPCAIDHAWKAAEESGGWWQCHSSVSDVPLEPGSTFVVVVGVVVVVVVVAVVDTAQEVDLWVFLVERYPDTVDLESLCCCWLMKGVAAVERPIQMKVYQTCEYYPQKQQSQSQHSASGDLKTVVSDCQRHHHRSCQTEEVETLVAVDSCLRLGHGPHYQDWDCQEFGFQIDLTLARGHVATCRDAAQHRHGGDGHAVCHQTNSRRADRADLARDPMHSPPVVQSP